MKIEQDSHQTRNCPDWRIEKKGRLTQEKAAGRSLVKNLKKACGVEGCNGESMGGRDVVHLILFKRKKRGLLKKGGDNWVTTIGKAERRFCKAKKSTLWAAFTRGGESKKQVKMSRV